MLGKLKKALTILVIAALLAVSSLVAVPTDDVLAQSQTFYPIAASEVTLGNVNQWNTHDATTYGVPSGATGIIWRAVNTAAPGSDYDFGVRMTGSSDNRIIGLPNSVHTWGLIGLNADEFDTYVEHNTNIDLYVIGYTTAGVTFFQDAYDKSLGSTGAWIDIDCSVECPGAVALIFEVVGTTSTYAYGIRPNGSSDAFAGSAYRHAQFGFITGCDGSQVCEGRIGNTGVDFYLVGYITDGVTMIDPATDLSLGATGSWTDLTQLPVGAIMGFFEVNSSATYQFGIRIDGSAEDQYYYTRNHEMAFVECSAGRLVEGKIANTGVDFYLKGYAIGSSIVVPTLTTNAASSVEATTATGNGDITNTGGENCDLRGVVWDDATHGDPGNTAPDLTDYVTAGGDYTSEAGSFGTGAFTASMTSLPTGTTIYYRAWAHNSAGYAYGAEVTFLTKPAAPTNVSATDGVHTDKVVVTWTKSTGATDYQVYRDGGGLGWAGDVATYDDNGATAGTITSAGTATASDGTSTAHVTLSLAGEATANGTSHTYKLRASNATGESSDSATDTGYRGVGAITYQWQVDNGGGFANIAGGTTDPYDYVGADAGTITAGNAVASDGTSSLHVTLSVTGESANNGTTWNYQCIVSSVGASNSPQTSTQDTGYRGTSTISYQWQVDSGGGFGNIAGGTTDPYNYTSADAPTIMPGTAAASDGTSSTVVALVATGETGNNGATWNYQCVLTAAWASNSPQTTAADTGYRGTAALTYQWRRSVADVDASFGDIPGATTDPYNDTDGAVTPSGRYYYATISMTGAAAQDTTHDRGYLSAATGGGTGILPIFLPIGLAALVLYMYERRKRQDEVSV